MTVERYKRFCITLASDSLGLFFKIYCCRKKNNNKSVKKNERYDKWEVKSDDVTVFEELGQGAFGKVYKGVMKTPPDMTHGSSVQQMSKKKAQLTITVAVKMLQGMFQRNFLDCR